MSTPVTNTWPPWPQPPWPQPPRLEAVPLFRIEAPHQAPSMNKLLRMHFRERRRLQDDIKTTIQVLSTGIDPLVRETFPLAGPIAILFERSYYANMFDWDNLASAWKLPGDSMVECGILADDSPKVIRHFQAGQFRSREPVFTVTAWKVLE